MSQQINLFNPIFLKQKKYFSALTMVQALGLITAGGAALSAYASYEMSALDKEAKTTSAQLAALQAKANKINAEYAPKQKSKSLEEEIRIAENELKVLQLALGVVQKSDSGGSASGYAEYMRAFSRQIVDGVWLTGFTIDGAGSDISIEGRALKPELVPAYITRLKREPVLQGKSFAALDMQVPQDGLVGKTGQSSAGKKAALAYISFTLQSSGMLKDQKAGKGAATATPLSTAEAYLESMRAAGATNDAAGSLGVKPR